MCFCVWMCVYFVISSSFYHHFWWSHASSNMNRCCFCCFKIDTKMLTIYTKISDAMSSVSNRLILWFFACVQICAIDVKPMKFKAPIGQNIASFHAWNTYIEFTCHINNAIFAYKKPLISHYKPQCLNLCVTDTKMAFILAKVGGRIAKFRW